MTEKPDKIHRVFVTRHFIAVRWYDVVSKTPAEARRKAKKQANTEDKAKIRAEAQDNGWIPDYDPVPVEIQKIGQGEGTYNMVETQTPGVFQDTR